MGLLGLFKFYSYNKKKKGSKSAIQLLLQKIIGIDGQISALQFFLNELHKPSEIGETQDENLRILQKCDALLLEIFHHFCQQHQLQYWIDFGSLLGAVRHGGFIPWDDDMDVSMPRKDYEKFLKYANSELVPLGFEVNEYKTGENIGFAYRHHETGIWLDVFPVDSVSTNLTLDEVEPLICESINNYRKRYKGTETIEKLAKKRETMINSKIPKGTNKIFYHGPEFRYPKHVLHNSSDIFPLYRLSFEGKEFFAPSCIDSYLKRYYGNGYMLFPKDGVLHHGDYLLRPPLSQWAKLNDINMLDIYTELQNKCEYLTSMINKANS